MKDGRALYAAGLENAQGIWRFVVGKAVNYEWEWNYGVRINPMAYFTSHDPDVIVDVRKLQVGLN